MNISRQPWSWQVKTIIGLLLLALCIYLLSRFSIVIAPFILAAILAYVLTPIANFFHARCRIPRVLAIFLSYVLLLVITALLPVVLLPTLLSEFDNLNLDIQRILQQVEGFLGRKYFIAGQTIDTVVIFDQIISGIQGLLEPIISQTLQLAVEFISSFIWIIFIVVVSFYLIKDQDSLRKWFENLMPPAYRQEFIALRDEIGQIWSAFFRGQLVLALVVACIFIVVGLVLGLPFALGMGVLAGLLEFLPSIGHGIWLTIASLLALFIGSTWLPIPNWVFTLILVGLHIVFQQFDLNYLIPRIIGRSVHLPPLVVILGIVTGAVLAGVMGIPLAAPTIASARVLGGYIYANLLDLPSFPEKETHPVISANPRWWQTSKKDRM